jgi:hypothetical protein
MNGRKVALYFAWSRPDEIAAPLGVLEGRFPALFELRRLAWPGLEQFANPAIFDQGIGGFLDHIQLANFKVFAGLVASWTGNPIKFAERRTEQRFTALDAAFLEGVDTLIVMSYESDRTRQAPSESEVTAVRQFLNNPEHMLFVCPHHDIGDVEALPESERCARQEAEYRHHGDHAIPAQQRFGDFGITLLGQLGLKVKNRHGLRPAALPDGSPVPLELDASADRHKLLQGVRTFNLHFHLPHLEVATDSTDKIAVVARQRIELDAPPHPFVAESGRQDFNVLLQSNPGVFAGTVLVCDTTTWSSTVGGLESLQRFWRNVVTRDGHVS